MCLIEADHHKHILNIMIKFKMPPIAVLLNTGRYLTQSPHLLGVKLREIGPEGGPSASLKFPYSLIVNLSNRTGEERKRQTLCVELDNNFV